MNFQDPLKRLNLLEVDKQELKEEFFILNQSLKVLTRKNCNSKKEIDFLQQKGNKLASDLEIVTRCLNEAADRIATHIKLESLLATDLIKTKNNLNEARIIKSKFRLRRVWLFSTTLCFMTIHKELSDFSIKIQDHDKTQVWKIGDLDSIFSHPAKSKHFFIKFCDGSVHEYFCESSEDVVMLVRDLMFEGLCN